MTSFDDDVTLQPSASGVSAENGKTFKSLPPVSTIGTEQAMEVNRESEKASKLFPSISAIETSQVLEANSESVRYRLYKQRFVGLTALVKR